MLTTFRLYPDAPPFSRIALGGSTFARETGQEAAFALMDHARARGVTMIDTAAVRVNGMGDESQYRTPEIIADAVSELFSREPGACTGRQLTDEEILREAGWSDADLDRYWVTGHAPQHLVTIAGADSIMR